jgi:HK97 family phage major capsid protein
MLKGLNIMRNTRFAVASASMISLAAHAVALPRGVFATPRADVGDDPKAMLAQINAAVAELRATYEREIGAKADDVVVQNKLDKLNASIDELTKNLDDQVKLMAAAQLGNGFDGNLRSSEPGYVAAFETFMRRGDESPMASMKKAVDGDGGYLAPVEWDRTITSKLKRISMIRKKGRVITIGSTGFKKLFSDRAIGSGWVGEIAVRPETTTSAIGQLDFTPGEIYANPAISQGLLDDSEIDLEQWLASEVDTEFSRQEGISFLTGNGVNKPYGVLTYVTGAVNAARHPWGAITTKLSGAVNAVTGDALLDLIFDLPSEFGQSAEFYMNRLTLGSVRKLKDGQGNYLWQPSYALGSPQMLAGYPVNEMPDMPQVATGNAAMLFGDMEATYLVVDRTGIRVLRDPFTNKPFVNFYTTKRVGGGVHNPEPMRALLVG